jgi:hypothetical protein
MPKGIIPGSVQNMSIYTNDDNRSVSLGANKNIYCGREVVFDKTPRKASSFLARGWEKFVSQIRRIRDFCILRGPALPSPPIRKAEVELMVTYIDAHLKSMQEVAPQVLAPPVVRTHSYVDASGLPVRGMHRWRQNRQMLSPEKKALNIAPPPPMLSSGERALNDAIQNVDSPFHNHFISLCEELRVNHPDMPVLTILSEANRQSFDNLKADLASEHPAELLSAVVDRIDAETRKLVEDEIYIPKLALGKAGAQIRSFQPSATEPALNHAKETQLPWFETKLNGTELELFKTFRESAVELLLEFLSTHAAKIPGTEFPDIRKTIVANFQNDFDELYQQFHLARNAKSDVEIPPVAHDLYKALASTTIDPGPYSNTKEYGQYLKDLIFRFELNRPTRDSRLAGDSRLEHTASLIPVVRQRPLNINPNPYLTKMPDQFGWG